MRIIAINCLVMVFLRTLQLNNLRIIQDCEEQMLNQNI